MAFTMALGMSDLPTVYNLTFAVGANLPNHRDDVLLVQRLIQLANFPLFSGGLPVAGSSLIKVDGWFGPETKRMIEAFEADQKKRGKLLVADGFFEPSSKDGFTGKGVLYKIIHLNRAAKVRNPSEYNFLPFDSVNDPILRGALMRGATPPPKPKFPGGLP